MTAWTWMNITETALRFILVGYYHAAYDMNLDGRLDILDIQLMINQILSAPGRWW